MTFGEILELIQRVDNLPGIMDIRVGRWCAWPIVRSNLRLQWVGRYHGNQTAPPPEKRPLRRRLDRIAQLLILMIGAVKGMAQLGLSHLIAPNAPILFASIQRLKEQDHGNVRDLLFDDLISGHELVAPRSLLELDSGNVPRYPGICCRIIPGLNLATLAYAVARLRSPSSVVKAGNALVELISRNEKNFDVKMDGIIIRQVLARFDASRLVHKRFFKRLRVQLLILVDADSHWAHIAAARELNARIIEVQHGMLAPNDVDLSWPGSYLKYKPAMPIPHRILLFGDVWQRFALARSFWNDHEMVLAGNAMMDRFLENDYKMKRSTKNTPITILFTTQWTSRSHAILFWEQFLSLISGQSLGEFQVILKIHPGESGDKAPYYDLAERFSKYCTISDSDTHILFELMRADISVSYYSTTLIEAMRLGIPTVSIKGGPSPKGFAATFGFSGLESIMLQVGTPAELLALLIDNRPGSKTYVEWTQKTEKAGKTFYKPGFIKTALNVIEEEFKKATK